MHEGKADFQPFQRQRVLGGFFVSGLSSKYVSTKRSNEDDENKSRFSKETLLHTLSARWRMKMCQWFGKRQILTKTLPTF